MVSYLESGESSVGGQNHRRQTICRYLIIWTKFDIDTIAKEACNIRKVDTDSRDVEAAVQKHEDRDHEGEIVESANVACISPRQDTSAAKGVNLGSHTIIISGHPVAWRWYFDYYITFLNTFDTFQTLHSLVA